MGTLFGLALIYFAPTCIAILRNHRNALAIAALNVLLGWTLLGWIAAAVWAMTSNVKPKELMKSSRQDLTGGVDGELQING